MTVEHNEPKRQADAVNNTPVGEPAVAHALRTQDTFTREQVAWLMAEAMRWGYEQRDSEDLGWHAGYQARVAEENAAWPPATYFSAGDLFRDLDRKAYREACDAAARLLRPGDFRGVGTPLRVVA